MNTAALKSLAAEYRPSMDAEVLHSWAQDIVKALDEQGRDAHTGPRDVWVVAVKSPDAADIAVWATRTEVDARADLREIYDNDGDIPDDADVVDALIAAGYDVTVAPHGAEWLAATHTTTTVDA